MNFGNQTCQYFLQKYIGWRAIWELQECKLSIFPQEHVGFGVMLELWGPNNPTYVELLDELGMGGKRGLFLRRTDGTIVQGIVRIYCFS